ncbi:NAD(P)/FAD-dependent oxidoreductase [Rhizobium sp. SSA_523]|uniref:NAD(P)/FAD-dependent oxidoreductase n=1 Tax=Rhizobium sp. SSA_523 TaxID=2952477 RepID=UPI002090FE31|nr:NAD(P)/FAD-dependent oxidoreductase [Rhizobium sp. SSA_523]MCO5734524.1 NAD(P)/FAD-dependent oxidoreductase [Rhizobium sp. SSA_523]WKC23234.1 NAD(P)/FAD-dependent oxidoreductase [Rhizobium sp. SSA_523]
MTDIDAIIVGAGVIGLACARELAASGRSVVVMEADSAIGTGTSSRSSEVIHAGLYYPPGSLKARLSVEGREALYAFCRTHGVAHRQSGKLIVATQLSEVPLLEALRRNGEANGCDDLRMLSAEEARTLEPALDCVAALLSPSTGIIDSHSYMLALLGDAQEAGAVVALRTPLLMARPTEEGFIVHAGGEEPIDLSCSMIVNAAGLQASAVARCVTGLDAAHVPETRYAKGNYFMLSGRAPFSHLIYPAPSAHGLGVHLTFDLAGQARFGPDVEWVDRIDYAVNPQRLAGFADAIRRYWPAMPKDALTPGYAGIRPKICGPRDPAADFRIDGPEAHGVRGLVNLFGIESPGLTASLAIAREVADRLRATERAAPRA